VFSETGSPSHRVISDQDVLRRWKEPGALFYSESFISVGFSSNDVTLAYVYDPDRSLMSLEAFRPENSLNAQLAFRVNGQEVYANSAMGRACETGRTCCASSKAAKLQLQLQLR